MALKYLTRTYRKQALHIRRTLILNYNLGPKKSVFGKGVRQISHSTLPENRLSPCEIWLNQQYQQFGIAIVLDSPPQLMPPPRTLLARFMLEYNLGAPLFVDIDPPLTSSTPEIVLL